MKRTLWPGLLLFALLTGCASAPLDTGAVPTVDTGVDPETWLTVPAGLFLQGQHEHEVLIETDYEIMQTDVTNAQYARYLNVALADGTLRIADNAAFGFYPGDVFHGHHHEVEIAAGDRAYAPLDDPALRLTWDGATFGVLPGYENHPATKVSWFGAWGYCQYYGWRLPSNAEWEKAARGTDNRPFPWGDTIALNNANFVSSHDLFERVSQGAGGTTPVGFYNGQSYGDLQTADSASPYGLYDMAGNVWQWTGDVQEGAHYRSLRGGSHTNYAYNLRVWTINNADPTHTSPSVGFRCARDG